MTFKIIFIKVQKKKLIMHNTINPKQYYDQVSISVLAFKSSQNSNLISLSLFFFRKFNPHYFDWTMLLHLLS